MGNRWGDYIRQMKQHSFVGRTEEIRLFKQFLSYGLFEKILYLWGPGGIGKSTLLQEFSHCCKEEGIQFIQLDSRDFPHTPEGFCKRLLSVLQNNKEHEERSLFEACIGALHKLGETEKIVLAIDTFEEMKCLEEWFREQFLVELTDSFLVVLAGRHPLSSVWLNPIWNKLIKEIPLSFFDLDTTKNYASSFSLSDQLHIQRIFALSKGHPLTLSLLVGLNPEELIKDENIDLSKILKQVSMSWLKETPGHFYHEFIEAACMVRVFNQESLESMLNRTISSEEFEQLLSLSFVKTCKRGWFIHDLIRPILLQDVRLRKPQIYAALWKKAISYFYSQLSTVRKDTWEIALDIVFLLEDQTLRSIFLTEAVKSSYYVSSVPSTDIGTVKAYMEEVKRQKLDVYQEFFDPQTNERYENIMPFQYIEQAYKIIDIEQWASLGEDCFYLIKDHHHQAVGLFIMIPIHKKSLPFLRKSTITKAYFKTLSETEYKKLENHHPDGPAGWFLLHIDQWLDHSPDARTAFFQFLMQILMKQGLFIHSSPLKLHHDVVKTLGFNEVIGAEHYEYGNEFLSRTFQLDLRGENFLSFIQALIKRAGETHTKVRLVETSLISSLTPRENEIAKWALKGLTNNEIAKHLYISEITVKKHLSSIYEKLGIKGKAQLVKKIINLDEEGW